MYLNQLGYHDPVYDDNGTPGGADVPIPVYPAPAVDSGFNPVIVGVVVLILLMMADSGK